MFICAVNPVASQESTPIKKRQAVLLPAEIALYTIAKQPHCPLHIVNIQKLFLLDGWTGYRYEVRNQGAKPIRSYSIAEVNTFGTASLFSRGTKTSGKWLMPTESEGPGGGEEIDVIPLTAQLRDQLKLNGPLKAVLVFLVVRVEFVDGSIYDDTPTYYSLKRFFLDNGVDPAPSGKDQYKE